MQISLFRDDVGMTCEYCGHQHIKNVYVVQDGEVTMRVGSECVLKIAKVNDYGIKVLKKHRNKIRSLEIWLKLCKAKDYDKISKKYYNGTTGGMTDEQFKAHMEWLATERLPLSIKNELKEINKQFKEIKIRTKKA